MTIDLNNKRIIVTGASSGIGRSTCTYLADLGAEIVLNGRSHEQLQQTIDELPKGSHKIAQLDLAANLERIPAWIKELAKERPFNGLVHCAGVEETVPLNQVDVELFNSLYSINTQAALFLAKGVAHKKSYSLPCSIVYISSVASLTGQACRSLYCSSKGALNAMARSLAVELSSKSIRVNTVCPGQVETEMDESVRSKIGQDNYQKIIDAHPLGIGKPEDVAGAVAFLLSDAARWITGTSLVVDGGYTAI